MSRDTPLVTVIAITVPFASRTSTHQPPRYGKFWAGSSTNTWPATAPVPVPGEFTQPGGGSTGQPEASTVVPGGVLGHRSRLSGTPSPSASGSGGCGAHSPLWACSTPCAERFSLSHLESSGG